MKNVLFLVFALALAFTTSGCEQQAVRTVPVIADQFIDFVIDGQFVSLKSISPQAYEPNSLRFNDQANQLILSRNSDDLETTFTIQAEDLPLVFTDGGVAVSTAAYAPATITVNNTEMQGSIYCPHIVEGTGLTIQYRGLIRVESISPEGRMRGSFKTDPSATDNAVTITDGRFDLVVPVF